MASVQPTGSVGFLGTPGITSGPDLETMFMALGFERTQLMDGVVKGSMEDMQKRNDQIAKANQTLQALRAASAAGGDPVKVTGDEATAMFKDLQAQGVSIPDGMIGTEVPADLQDILNLIDGRQGLGGYRGDIWWRAPEIIATAEKYGIDLGDIQVKTHSSGQKYLGPTGGSTEAKWDVLEDKFREKIAELSTPKLEGSKEQWAALVDNVKTQIDTLSSSSQLDMIKLQGLINKRNQGIEMLTNLVQKFQQTNNTIVGNMR
jgi:hypothetical protein